MRLEWRRCWRTRRRRSTGGSCMLLHGPGTSRPAGASGSQPGRRRGPRGGARRACHRPAPAPGDADVPSRPLHRPTPRSPPHPAAPPPAAVDRPARTFGRSADPPFAELGAFRDERRRAPRRHALRAGPGSLVDGAAWRVPARLLAYRGEGSSRAARWSAATELGWLWTHGGVGRQEAPPARPRRARPPAFRRPPPQFQRAVGTGQSTLTQIRGGWGDYAGADISTITLG